MVLDLFKRIPAEDLPLIWLNESSGRPENLILTDIMVPPVTIRPSVMMESSGGSNEDDITMILQDIVRSNAQLQNSVGNGANMRIIMDNWDHLQILCAELINGDLPGMSTLVKSAVPKRSLVQRLKGKQGRFRGNLSGKRVEFSGRTVISPDPNLSIEEVGVPVMVAKKLTYPERVTAFNIERLRSMVQNGAHKYPGANMIRPTNSRPISLLYGDRARAAANLRIGDIVERHLLDGDVSLFNRQPSLHRMSIMSHRVRVLPWRTFRFNECDCAPYNADFDGDEMNIHIPQTEEARIEARELMGIKHNIINPRSGEPLITATQDFITGSFVITQRDVFFSRFDFCRLVAYLSDAQEVVRIPMPALLKPVVCWTGKQVYSMLLKPNEKDGVLLSLEMKAKNFSITKLDPNPWMCPNDGYVVIQNSELMCGNIDKNCIGGNKKGLICVLVRDFTPEDTVKTMGRMTKMTSRFLMNYGFTIGLDDVTPDAKLLERMHEIVAKNYAKVDETIHQYNDGKLALRPGCNAEQTLESICSGLLSDIRDTIGKLCMTNLPKTNYPLIMATCGSKGSAINICQMIYCVGQQVVSGNRIPDGFIQRSLPHFLPNAKEPKAKGFVANSFYSGLTPMEFFFHTMGGREGLVDSAVKTADTGYMQRRLMKALEDLCISYDGTVRTADNEIVQLVYGDDNLNASFMESNNGPVDYDRTWSVIQLHFSNHAQKEPYLTPREILEVSEDFLNEDRFTHMCGDTVHGNKFIHELMDFIQSVAARASQERVLVGLDDGYYYSGYSDNGRRFQLDRAPAVMQKRLRQLPESAVSRTQLKEFFDTVYEKYRRAIIEPGEAVGAISGQSFGEPATQMTLKTFHFAGVASMDITQGVPRIKEIINATPTISTPIITVELQNNQDEISARVCKGRLERTLLGEVAEYIKEVFTPEMCFLDIQLDSDAIQKLYLPITAESVRKSIINSKLKLKLKDEHISTNGQWSLRIIPPSPAMTAAHPTRARGDDQYFTLQRLKEMLPSVIVNGIPSVHRAVLNKVEKPTVHMNLLIDGTGLLQVMGTVGVDHTKTVTNHVLEIQSVLGIEAARTVLIQEVSNTYGSYGLSIDIRHQMLLADCMTFKGQVLGITRFGIEKMKESVMTLASFEKTADHLFDAALHGRHDKIIGVSDRVILGIPIALGTGLFSILSRPTNFGKVPPKKMTYL